MHVYHFAREEQLESILAEGLKAISRYNRLPSRLRQNVVYAWLTPSHDRMGYRGNAEYACLRLTVLEERCLVANMDLISAAWVNWIGAGGQPRDQAMAERLVHVYDETAVPIEQYRSGLFRAPEVIVFGNVEPKSITLCADNEQREEFEDNEARYQERCASKLSSLAGFTTPLSLSKLVDILSQRQLIRRVAIHDDVSGWLATYLLESSDEFYTIRIEDEIAAQHVLAPDGLALPRSARRR